MDGLLGVMRDLVADGNSVVVVDHDTRVLAAMDHWWRWVQRPVPKAVM